MNWLGETIYRAFLETPVIQTQPLAGVQIKTDWQPITKKKLHKHFDSQQNCFSPSIRKVTSEMYYHMLKHYKALSSRFGPQYTKTPYFPDIWQWLFNFLCFWIKCPQHWVKRKCMEVWLCASLETNVKYNSTAVTVLHYQLWYQCHGKHPKIQFDTLPTKRDHWFDLDSSNSVETFAQGYNYLLLF